MQRAESLKSATSEVSAAVEEEEVPPEGEEGVKRINSTVDKILRSQASFKEDDDD